jgi:hypothetical protein
LPSYRGGNDREKASCGVSVQWRSGSMDSSDDGGVGGGSSSRQWIGTGGFGVAARWRWRGSAMAARVSMAMTSGKAPIYRGQGPA